MAKVKELLKTRHGSHLYGLATETSDQDFYEIYKWNFMNYRPALRKQSVQTIDAEEDKLRISLDRFTALLYKGVPQTLEALFARPDKWLYWHADWPDMQAGLAKNLWRHKQAVVETYIRTANNFMQQDDFKKNRHAFRLLLNIAEYTANGQFNPTLNMFDIQRVNYFANLVYEKKLTLLDRKIAALKTIG